MEQNEVLNELLGLTIEETQLLYSIERLICQKSYLALKDDKEKQQAYEWWTEWEKGINAALHTMSPDGEKGRYTILYRDEAIALAKKSKTKTKLKTSLYLIILEACLFKPYYPIFTTDSNDKEEQKQIEEKNKAVEKIKKCYDSKFTIEVCKEFCRHMDLDENKVVDFIDKYETAKKSISGYWFKVILTGTVIAVFGAIAAAFFGPAIAAGCLAGELSGAAAVSAALATLGGGAIAVGGFGMAGGMVVVVGGGAILGGTLGAGAGMLIASSPELALSQAAKLEVVLKEIVLGQMKDIKLAQEILKRQNKYIAEMKEQLLQEKMKNEKNKEAIKNLEEVIEYLEKAYKDNLNNVEGV